MEDSFLRYQITKNFYTHKMISFKLMVLPNNLLFVFLLLCSTLCLSVHASSGSKVEEITELFFLGGIKNYQKPNGDEEVNGKSITPEKIKPPFFVAAKGGVIVVITEAMYTEKSGGEEKKVHVLTKYLKAEKGKLDKKAMKMMSSTWKTQLVTENSAVQSTLSTIVASAINANGDKIYVFLLNIRDVDTKKQCDFKLFKGEINLTNENKPIKWSADELSGLEENEDVKKKLTESGLGSNEADGSVFFIEDNQIMVVVKSKSADKNDNVVIFLQFENDKKQLKLLPVDGAEVLHSSFFQWEGNIFKAPANADGKGVMVFDKNGNVFTKSDSPITRLRDFLKDKRNFVTAAIDKNNDNVLFFTHLKTEGEKKNIHLWMSDGTRVICVGIIVNNVDDTFYGSVLYTNDELFLLHQRYILGPDGSPGPKVEKEFLLVRLKDQLDNIKFFLKEWEEGNNTVLALCNDVENSNISCTVPPPTDGVVGFLRETTDGGSGNTIWKDKYYYLNVTVENGEKVKKVPNGLKFSGEGAGAKWSVSQEKKTDQPYNFAAFGFTLVATVTIENKTNSKKNSILGVKLTSNTNIVGLWCNTDGKWAMSDEDDTKFKKSNEECKQGHTYNVALVLEAQNLKIYINGENLTNEVKTIEPSENIEHFYFGAKNNQNAESYVTVTNVLLYNRPFNGSEIGNLKKYVRLVKVVTAPDHAVGTNTGGGNSDEPTTLPTSSDEKKEKDGGVGGGVRVFSLLLALLCVSAPLLHL